MSTDIHKALAIRRFVAESAVKWGERGIAVSTCEACGLVTSVSNVPKSKVKLSYTRAARCHCMDEKGDGGR